MQVCRLLAIVVCLGLSAPSKAFQSAVWFSPDGHFSEYADPSTQPVDSFPIEAEYGFDNFRAQLSQTSVGWTFQLTQAAPLGGLGVYDYGADGLLADHLVGLWKLPDSNVFDLAEPVAMSLIEKGLETPFDGQWRYSESLYSHPTTSNALSELDRFYLDRLSDDPETYWEVYRDRVQTLAPGDPLQEVLLEPGNYAILSNQIASATNREAARLESAHLIDLYWFIEPVYRYPGHDPRVDIEAGYTVPIGPDAYDLDALGQPHEFFPTNAQLFSGMMVGPTLFLGAPEPSSWMLVAFAISLRAMSSRRLCHVSCKGRIR